MASCSDYEGSYTVTQTSCLAGCTVPPGSSIQVVCSPTMQFLLNSASHAASVNSFGQIEVPSLDLVASVTGVLPQRFLFGVAQPTAASTSGSSEVWGAEEGGG